MKRIINFFIIITLFLASCTEEERDYTGNIQGIVTESGTTNPISGVQVSVVDLGASTTTGSDGQFRFSDLEAQNYQLQFKKNGYITNTRNVNVLVGETAKCDMQLEKEKEEAEIEITPSTLNFGTAQTELSVTVTNHGNAATEWALDMGNNAWLTASPLSGNIAGNKTQSIVFTVNRDKLSETKNVKVTLSAFGNSYTISVSCAPVNAKSEMAITPTSIDFGDTDNEKNITIKNTGNAPLTWNISGITEESISVSETEGTVESEGSKVIKVKLDRTKLNNNLNTSFVISDGIKEQTVTVKATKVEEKAEMKIEPTLLDFGHSSTELPLTVSNTGKAELKYSVSGISVNYITVTPMEGSVAAEGNQVLQVKLDRETMPENANTTFKISDGTNEESITVKATKPVAKMEVSPLSLDFGEEATEKVFTISNTGTAEFTWNITVPTGTGLTVSETSGVTKPAETKQITVTLDRSIMPETLNTTIEVSDGVNKEKISVNAIKGSAIAGTVVTQGLYTYYKFDGNFEDATENGINGFGSPAPSFVEGVIPEGKAIKFSKTDNSTFVVSKPIIDSKEMTISFWGKDFSDGHIFHLNSSYENYPMLSLSIVNGALKFAVDGYRNHYQFENDVQPFVHPTLTDGKWHHIAIISDYHITTIYKVTATLYVDGMEVYTITQNYTDSYGGYGTGTSFTMGGSLKLNNSLTLPATNMSVDNFRVYDTRRLSANEIKEIYNNKQ
ncbi:MSP (Major sperm protein) domain [uncultured Bacteroides sp.]|uniref:BACON domain-containing protein n=1 Tax=Bacteroides cellulolyticus TaxID=2981780 RepID=UPI000821F699|nr:carboxypeptidase regulatory-like domain-containing protein [Bacteroides cellulolyticus]MCU6771762.1 carboxypeptidase regulatory-like domain-containing protein [Bacteroides cellulolyticus]SCI02813.1 MSP (Major sperm protein) domain [uncultured Bacteroides sp.]